MNRCRCGKPEPTGNWLRVLPALAAALALLFLTLTGAWALQEQELTIKNAGLSRTISNADGLLKTVRLEANGVQMLDTPSVAFMIELEHDGEFAVLVPIDFKVFNVVTDDTGVEHRITVELASIREGFPVRVRVNYFAPVRARYLQKSVEIECTKPVPGAVIRRVVIEDCSFRSNFVPVAPVNRYENAPSDSPPADLSDVKTRFTFDRNADFAAIDPDSGNGLYFFTGSLFGRERFSTRGNLTMYEEVWVPLSQGYKTSRATIGSVSGPPEIIYKRFREFLWDNYCSMRGKPMLYQYETWMYEKQHVSEDKCLSVMKAMQQEGWFNAFHLDYGWENHYPLTEDPVKFPGGLQNLAKQAQSMGLDMVYWINPLGSKGQTTDSPQWGGAWDGLINDHPEWFVTYDPASKSITRGNDILSYATPYADYVEQKLLRLANDCGAVMFYLDGSDWNIFKSPPGTTQPNQDELRFNVLQKLKSTYTRLHKARSGLVICLSPQVEYQPCHAHRLDTVDQIEFWDGTADGCLGDRQQRYNQTFIFPLYTIHSGWYVYDMEGPLEKQKYVVASTMSGYPQNQGTYLIANPNADLSAYLKKFMAFRKRFEDYFAVYQHVLDFPDGRHVDGEGHIIDNKGFIVLFNPSDEAQRTALPLEEPELELVGDIALSDWTELDFSIDMGAAKVGDRVEVELQPLSFRIIGINIEQSSSDNAAR